MSNPINPVSRDFCEKCQQNNDRQIEGLKAYFTLASSDLKDSTVTIALNLKEANSQIALDLKEQNEKTILYLRSSIKNYFLIGSTCIVTFSAVFELILRFL